jgi:hypothetical protein
MNFFNAAVFNSVQQGRMWLIRLHCQGFTYIFIAFKNISVLQLNNKTARFDLGFEGTNVVSHYNIASVLRTKAKRHFVLQQKCNSAG